MVNKHLKVCGHKWDFPDELFGISMKLTGIKTICRSRKALAEIFKKTIQARRAAGATAGTERDMMQVCSLSWSKFTLRFKISSVYFLHVLMGVMRRYLKWSWYCPQLLGKLLFSESWYAPQSEVLAPITTHHKQALQRILYKDGMQMKARW